MATDVPDFQAPPPPQAFPPAARDLMPALTAQKFASFWRRLVAWILDFILLVILGFLFRAILASFPLGDLPIVEVLYSVGFIAVGATPGMRALGIRVIDRAGNPPGVKRAVIRYIIPALSWLPGLVLFSSPGVSLDLSVPIFFVASVGFFILGILDPIWMIWDAQKQTLHDKLASTFVVKTD